MSGRRRRGGATELLQVRLTPEEKARWLEYVDRVGGYLGVMVRTAVEELMVAHPDPRKDRLRFW